MDSLFCQVYDPPPPRKKGGHSWVWHVWGLIVLRKRFDWIINEGPLLPWIMYSVIGTKRCTEAVLTQSEVFFDTVITLAVGRAYYGQTNARVAARVRECSWVDVNYTIPTGRYFYHDWNPFLPMRIPIRLNREILECQRHLLDFRSKWRRFDSLVLWQIFPCVDLHIGYMAVCVSWKLHCHGLGQYTMHVVPVYSAGLFEYMNTLVCIGWWNSCVGW